jgi:hypothetical protein
MVFFDEILFNLSVCRPWTLFKRPGYLKEEEFRQELVKTSKAVKRADVPKIIIIYIMLGDKFSK